MVSCKDYVAIRKQELKDEIKFYDKKPVLLVIQVDHDKASSSYVAGKKKDCDEVGITFLHAEIDSEIFTQEMLESFIRSMNNSPNCDGIILQLPIPKKYNVEKLQQCISPSKDVDGFRRDSYFKPCTPKGIMDWLAYNKYELAGKDVVVIGRSKIVGKPLVNMLIDAGATVTCCNSKTSHLDSYTVNADLVVSAVGKAKIFDFSYFSTCAEIIVDVGINRDENGKLCGDVCSEYFDKYLPCTYVTPVPGGVGLLTRLALLENLFEAYKLNK